jgi:ribonuclease P protein component
VFYILTESDTSHIPPGILISVPKKKFKKATDRNRLKRLVRESYRLHKSNFLLSGEFVSINIGFVYTAKTVLTYTDIESGMKSALEELNEIIN